MTLTGKSALITAGASGIGRAMAEALEQAGAKVWVIDAASQAVADCPDHWQTDCLDVRDPAAMADLFQRIEAKWGNLDILCANAGIAGPTALIEDQTLDGFRDCVSVNVEGAFLSAKGAVPMMKRQGAGSIIFTSSTAGLFGYPYRAPYAAAKWAIHGLMKTVAMEAGPFGIRANAIAPGAVDGPRMDGVIAREADSKGTSPDAIRTAYEAGTSMRTFVTAADIANTATFLASDAAQYISGQVLAVDGHTENPDPKVP